MCKSRARFAAPISRCTRSARITLSTGTSAFGRRHPFGRYHPPSGLGVDAGVDDAGENSRDESNADAVTSVAMG